MKKVYLTKEQLDKLNMFLGNSKVKGVDVDFFQAMRKMFSNGNSEFELKKHDIKKLISILNTTLLKGYDASIFVSIQESLLTDGKLSATIDDPIDAPVDNPQVPQSEVKPGLYETPKKKAPNSFSAVLDRLKNDSKKNIDEVEDDINEIEESEEIEEIEEQDVADDEKTVPEEKKKDPVNIPFNAERVDPSNDNAVEGFFSTARNDSDYF